MATKQRSWRQKRRNLFVVIAIIALIVGVIALVPFRYISSWNWTAFSQKTLWDWLQLLIVPLALAVAALLFNFATTRTEQRIAAQRYEQDQHITLDKQREDLLQAYLDRMSELLLKEKLRSSAVDAEVRNVARVRTITILFQLDARRIGYVFAFLREAGLMSNKPNSSIVSLSHADLSKINLSQANLSGANLSETTLSHADLSGANLSDANLFNADFSGANLDEAKLIRADLRDADLSRADLSYTDLSGTNLCGAILDDADLNRAELSETRITEKQLKRVKSRIPQIFS